MKLRGVTTVEVMVMMIAISLVILASSTAQISAFRSYKELIYRERAELYAAETLEQFEAMKRTRLQQDYILSWEKFLGNKKGTKQYRLIGSETLGDMTLQEIPEGLVSEETPDWVKIYELSEVDQASKHDFYSRLERRITIAEVPNSPGEPQKRLVKVSVFWGLPEKYTEDSLEQVKLQALFSDHTKPGFAL